MNSFVSYLNTLHSGDANNKGALAESQAKEPLFSQLQVDHPWALEIFDSLVSADGRSVILSGHAGDGKSTIAIEILKRLKKIEKDKILPDGLQREETVVFDGRRVTVVKDLSECTESARENIFIQLLSGERYLLISNTGTLLDFFKRRSDRLGKSMIEIENDLLTALDSSQKQSMVLGVGFSVYNLAQYDNVDLGLKLLERMVESSEWSNCAGCACKDACPILRNRLLIAKYRNRVLDRIRLLYFRTYAYGERLTMRQISAHFSYMLTAALDCTTIQNKALMGDLGPMERYLFVNRFWGDDGLNGEPGARQMKAIRVFVEQHLNSQFSPSLERKFWDSTENMPCFQDVPEIAGDAARVLKRARRVAKPQEAAHARHVWRRMIFFLHEPDAQNVDAMKDYERFEVAFLDSPMILKFRNWQLHPETFRAKSLLPSLFSVLQEEFCGVLPLEGSSQTKDLYITLRRKSPEIKQSAQLVLRRFSFSENFKLKIRTDARNTPWLVGTGNLSGVNLELNLSFLDYIVTRKEGAIGRGLSLSYRDRLEKLMAQIVYNLHERESDGLLILKHQENGKLSTVSVNVTEEGLEVSND